MDKKVLVISTSLRKGGNSEALADEFVRGAVSAGNRAEKLCLHGKTVTFCRGCFACLETHRCVIRDDADAIVQKMRTADVLVFATPIYYYEMSGQMKTLLDRANPLFDSDYRFRDVYLLTAAAENEEYVPQRAESGLRGWIECFPRARFAGAVFGGGDGAIGGIKGNPALEKAFELGRSV